MLSQKRAFGIQYIQLLVCSRRVILGDVEPNLNKVFLGLFCPYHPWQQDILLFRGFYLRTPLGFLLDFFNIGKATGTALKAFFP